MINIWKKLEEKTLITSWRKEFRKAIFLDPSGKKTEFMLYGQSDWVVVLPLTPERLVVTLRQYYHGVNKILLVLAGGDLKKGELAEAAAARELEEETGYRASRIILLGCPLGLSVRNSWTHYYTCLGLDCKKTGNGGGDYGDAEIELIPLKEWVEKARTEIEDPAAVIATFRSIPYLKESLY